MTRRPSAPAAFLSRNLILIILGVVYAVGASVSAGNLIKRAESSTQAIEKIFGLYSLKNEGSQALERYNHEHPFLGFFIDSPARQEMELPSAEESNEALHSELPHDLRLVREESRQPPGGRNSCSASASFMSSPSSLSNAASRRAARCLR